MHDPKISEWIYNHEKLFIQLNEVHLLNKCYIKISLCETVPLQMSKDFCFYLFLFYLF